MLSKMLFDWARSAQASKAKERSKGVRSSGLLLTPVEQGKRKVSVPGGGTVSLDPQLLLKVWKYLDPAGEERGAFSTLEMRSWFTRGYFSNDLRIRWSDVLFSAFF
jgi:hypothetical protein